MKEIDHQFQRLLRAAAAGAEAAHDDSGRVPSVEWLLRQRRQEGVVSSGLAIRPVLQGGLAVACLLLLVASLINLQQMERANQDVFAVSETALTRLVIP